jgi:hypothetical protein
VSGWAWLHGASPDEAPCYRLKAPRRTRVSAPARA